MCTLATVVVLQRQAAASVAFLWSATTVMVKRNGYTKIHNATCVATHFARPASLMCSFWWTSMQVAVAVNGLFGIVRQAIESASARFQLWLG